MSDVAIRAEKIGKQYRIGERATYGTLRDSLTGLLRAPFGLAKSVFGSGDRQAAANGRRRDNTFWALRDISFEVKHGEVVGIIGRNGAGKSTLLKILSRITEPTEGYAQINGRVGSLLEVGTGFHPELSGRENIVLNGSILGMKRVEIERKFDEIVDFAEIEKFIDTPVKFYSSGMYMRLAFAVAAYLEPEILLVDEVLAVGDAAFQEKCLGKMKDVARQGRTVLFVSHNLGSIANLCTRGILLVQGQKWREGPIGPVINEYISLGRESLGEAVWLDPATAPGNEKVRLHAVRIISDGEPTADVDIQKDVQVVIDYWNLSPGARLSVSIHLLDKMGVGVLAAANFASANLVTDEWFGREYPGGLFRSVCTIPGNFLNEGRYSINAIVLSNVVNVEVIVNEVVSFTVYDTGAMRKEYGGGWLGVVRPKLAWQTEFLSAAGQDQLTVEPVESRAV